MSSFHSLSHHLLVAAPTLKDPNFDHAVIYICEHQSQGSVGLIINHPMSFQISVIFKQLNIEPIHVKLSERPLLFGGPVQPERGFVIHKQAGHWHSSINLSKDVMITTSNDIIRAIAIDEGPKDLLITLGYTAWNEHQLEQEIMKDDWVVCPFSPEILYDVPFTQRWKSAGHLLGIDLDKLTSQSGHA